MRILKYVHSCLLLEEGGDKILFDPGKFSFVEGVVEPDAFQDLSAIINTHQHPDHMDDDALKKIINNNPAAIVITNAEQDITAELLESGSRAVGGFNVEAVTAEHAPILDAERPRNVAYRVNRKLLHPGDYVCVQKTHACLMAMLARAPLHIFRRPQTLAGAPTGSKLPRRRAMSRCGGAPNSFL